MSEPNYQFRDYPRAIAERAWQRLTGHHQWMTLDRFTAILLKTANDEGHSRELVKAAVCSKAFCGPSGRRLVLFFRGRLPTAVAVKLGASRQKIMPILPSGLPQSIF
jgi:hypothetical protein